jgi:hypothetical protein
MKTINDLMQLIAKETELNDGKIIQYTFSIDTDNLWLTMKEHANIVSWVDGEIIERRDHQKTIFQLESFKTPEELQYLYWKVFINGRTRLEKENWNEYSIKVGINQNQD